MTLFYLPLSLISDRFLVRKFILSDGRGGTSAFMKIFRFNTAILVLHNNDR
ncbi:hypothetical protein [Nostoc sp.]